MYPATVRNLGGMPFGTTIALALASDAGGFLLMLIVLVAIAVPLAAIAFARSGKGLAELGKGRFAVDFDRGDDDSREDEVRQLVEARAWRRAARGEDPGDTEAETARILALDPQARPGLQNGRDRSGTVARDGQGPDSMLRDEIRQVVLARNESRRRRGEEPLDVEAEIGRLLRDLA